MKCFPKNTFAHEQKSKTTIPDYYFSVRQLNKKKYIVLRVPKLFKMVRLLKQDLCSVQSRLFCHNS